MTEHRRLAVDAFNHVWTLIDKPDRTRAHEALARAYQVAGRAEEASRHEAQARRLGAKIAEEDDREHLFEALETLSR